MQLFHRRKKAIPYLICDAHKFYLKQILPNRNWQRMNYFGIVWSDKRSIVFFSPLSLSLREKKMKFNWCLHFFFAWRRRFTWIIISVTFMEMLSICNSAYLYHIIIYVSNSSPPETFRRKTYESYEFNFQFIWKNVCLEMCKMSKSNSDWKAWKSYAFLNHLLYFERNRHVWMKKRNFRQLYCSVFQCDYSFSFE